MGLWDRLRDKLADQRDQRDQTAPRSLEGWRQFHRAANRERERLTRGLHLSGWMDDRERAERDRQERER